MSSSLRRASRRNACSARRRAGTPAAYPSVNRVATPSRSRSIGRGGCGPGGAARAASATSRTPHRAAEPAGEDRRSERFEVRLARQPRVERLEPFGRIEQQRRSVTPAAPGKHDLGAQPGQPRALELVQRADLRGREELVAPRRGRRPRTWPARRPARGLARRAGSGVSSVARSRNAAAAAMPPRLWARSADRSSSSATASSGPTAAWARCHARRSGSASGSVTSASARWISWRSRGLQPRGRPPSAPADDGTAPGRRTRSAPSASAGAAASAPIPSCSAARHSRVTSPTGSAAAASSSRCVSTGSDPIRRRKLCSMRLASGRASGRPNPPASSAAVKPRGSSSKASGLPRVSATIRSRTRSSSRPGIAESSSARASLSLRPPTTSTGRSRSSGSSLGLPHREHQGHRFRQQPPRHEGKDLRRSPIEPLRVIHQADQRLLLGDLGQQAQHGQTRPGSDPPPLRR